MVMSDTEDGFLSELNALERPRLTLRTQSLEHAGSRRTFLAACSASAAALFACRILAWYEIVAYLFRDVGR